MTQTSLNFNATAEPAETMRGTCPVCFREMDVDNGGMHRHGWQETGGRQVGQYGQVMQVGECFGVGLKPFETSPEGTVAFLEAVLFPASLRTQNVITGLEARPALTVEYTFDTGEKLGSYKTRKEARMFTLAPGETVEVETSADPRRPTRKRRLVYEAELNRRLDKAASHLRRVKREGLRLAQLVAEWKPGKLRSKKAKGPTRHFKREGARSVSCGAGGHSLVTTDNRDEVTCSSCLKTLKRLEAKKAAKAQTEEDFAAMREFLTKNGPSPAKVIKKHFGWDTKRFNKVARSFETSWSAKPKTYMTQDQYQEHMAEMKKDWV